MQFSEISTEKLTSGEVISLASLEVTSVPHISIIDDNPNASTEVLLRYKNEFNGLLKETYQTYKTMSISAGYSKDISVELLWKTTEVKNQPFKASIRLFIVVRAIDNNEASAKKSVESLIKLCQSTLALQKYEYKTLSYDELSPVVKSVVDTNIRAIVKEEKAENLQNQLLPFCFSYRAL